jgi:hypothetical protein
MGVRPGELDVQTRSDKVEVQGMQLEHYNCKRHWQALINAAESSLRNVTSA